MNALSDEDLMEQYQMGHPQAFDILFQRHGPRIQGYLTKKTGSAKHAQDLSQEAFLKLHRSKHLYQRHLPFLPWLFSIVRSVLLDDVKKRKREIPISLNAPHEFATASEPSAEIEAVSLTLLPTQQKEAVALRIFEDATFEEIAKRLSTSENNARKLVSRGLNKLREIYVLKRSER